MHVSEQKVNRRRVGVDVDGVYVVAPMDEERTAVWALT